MDKSELVKYIGNLSQLGGCRNYELTDGWARKMRAIDISTGAGLQYTVLPDRGMDISHAKFKGTNLVFLTSNGETSPSYFEPENIGWLHTFAGGLLTTCGLTHLGPPSVDEGEVLGLHGRYSTIPARQVADLSQWIDGNYQIRVKGIVEEGYLFGNKLRMEREISSVMDQNRIHISDTISNFGHRPSPYTTLYHMNFGYPLLSEDAELIINPLKTISRDEIAAGGINEFRQFIKPQPDYEEQVFFHEMEGNKNGEALVSLVNQKMGIKVNLEFNVDSLPYLTQWKMMGYGEYVLGLEPCNVFCKSRKELREENSLPFLQAGESTTNNLEISIDEI